MNSDVLRPRHEASDQLWRRFLIVAACLMAAAVVYRLPMELWRMALEPLGNNSAHDFYFRFQESREWFAGRPVYGVILNADYPPASYLLLWPFTSWPWDIARLVWAASTIAALTWLCLIVIRESRARTGWERAFVALIPLSSYATAATIRVGQMGLQLLPLLVAGLVLLARQERSWKRDLIAAGLLLVAVAKPTFSAPFFWIAFFVGGVRLTTLVLGGYVALTLWSASYQPDSVVALMQGWLMEGDTINTANAHGNIHSMMGQLGLKEWNIPVSLAILGVAGLWTWRYRKADTWLLIGVAAIVARMWSHHRWYDDVLLLLPVVTLWREMRSAERTGKRDFVAMGFLVVLWALGVAPAQVLAYPAPWGDLFKVTKTLTWIALLVELTMRTQRAPVSRHIVLPAERADVASAA